MILMQLTVVSVELWQLTLMLLQAPGYEAVVFERPLLQAVGDVARSWWAAARARLPHGGYRGGSSSGSTGSNSVGSRGPAASREDPHT